MAKKIYVGNLAWSTTTDDLKAAFAQNGNVVSATVMIDKMTGRSRGFGFVEMEDADADAAIAAWNGKDLGGRALIVNEARPMTEQAPRRFNNGPRRDGGMGGMGGGMDRGRSFDR